MLPSRATGTSTGTENFFIGEHQCINLASMEVSLGGTSVIRMPGSWPIKGGGLASRNILSGVGTVAETFILGRI